MGQSPSSPLHPDTTGKGHQQEGQVGISKEKDNDDDKAKEKISEEFSSSVKSSDAAAMPLSDVKQFDLVEHSRQNSDEQVVPQFTLGSSTSKGERHLLDISPFEYNENTMVGC